ncbi:MAG: DUF4271 domain-containing protein [Bacteroidaceae bacterium]|nr:DUF4271 domain-containing protein [Bacteroidaceae bacterium]
MADTLPHTGSLIPPVPEDSASEAQFSGSFVMHAIHAESADSDDAVFPFPYPEGFFAQSTLFHTETTWHESGYIPMPLSRQPWRDDWMTTAVLLCFIATLIMLRRYGKQLLSQAVLFFLPSHRYDAESDSQPLSNSPLIIFSILLLSFTTSFAGLRYVIYDRQVFLGSLSPYLLLGILALCFIVATLVKFALYRFVDWTFFNKQNNLTWQGHYRLLFVVESLALFVVIVLGAYLGISSKISLAASVYIVIFVKLLLFLKGYQIFFSKFYGIFHEIMYLCTLEAVPLLVVVKVLTQFARKLNVIF